MIDIPGALELTTRSMSTLPPEERLALVVDGDEGATRGCVEVLSRAGFSTQAVGNHADAVAFVATRAPECAVVAASLPDGSGLDLVRELRSRVERMRIVVVAGFGSIRSAVQAMRVGAADYLVKPVRAEELLVALDPRQDEALHSPEEPAIPTLERARWEHIQQVLSHCHGNISEAARVLGLHRQSLQRMLRRHPPPR